MTKTLKLEADQHTISANALKAIIDRLESLEAQKADVLEDLREVYKEASSQGFDTATLRKVIRIRRADAKKLEEQEYLLDLYKNALGM